MNYYELLCIVHPALEAGRLKDIIVNVQDLIKSNKGTLVCTEVWGKKKLAHFIEKQKYGTYVLLQFQSDGRGNNNINKDLEHNPNVLAYLTTKIESDDIRKLDDDLDAQIAGKEVNSSKTTDKKTGNDSAEKISSDSSSFNNEIDNDTNEKSSETVTESKLVNELTTEENSDEKLADESKEEIVAEQKEEE